MLSLFGIQVTYVSNAQNTTEPYLKGFSRTQHKAILFDEATPNMVLKNKQLFQANSDGASTGMTPSGQYLTQFWLYQVPILICCNEWLTEEMKAKPEYQWIIDNSEVVHIEKPCWKIPLPGDCLEDSD